MGKELQLSLTGVLTSVPRLFAKIGVNESIAILQQFVMTLRNR